MNSFYFKNVFFLYHLVGLALDLSILFYFIIFISFAPFCAF